MGLIEGFRTRVSQNIFRTNKNNLPLYVVPDVSSEQITLPTSIKERAHTIAENVRKYGEQKFGPMWAQGYAVLPDDRIVFLQQSIGASPIDHEVLEINLPNTPNKGSIHIQYDLRLDKINTYESRFRDWNTEILIVYDRLACGSRIPKDVTFRDIDWRVKDILQSVEIASNKIMWKEPDSSTLPRTNSAQIEF
jgi:hypothetical protein